MDAFSVYLNTFRYVMNADPQVKATWCDIFKYLPCLRGMLSCSVCGNLLRNPHGAANGVCLHHVCYKCIGGKMVLKPLCSWCKDQSNFKENKKLRILVLCFKRLCAYISKSPLGSKIHAVCVENGGSDQEVENTQKALEDAEQSDDEFQLTPPPAEPMGILKPSVKVKEHKYSFTEYKPSTSGFVRNHISFSPQELNVGVVRNQRDKRRKGVSNVTIKSSPKTNASVHVKRLKRKALTTSRRKNATSKSLRLKIIPSDNDKNDIRQKKNVQPGGLLISQRPHRELSGKFSVGQLWRETFLEERSPEPEIYPDSGIDIEVGNFSDQDHSALSPKSIQLEPVKENKPSVIAKVEKVYPTRETRLHPIVESQDLMTSTVSCRNDSVQPTLTLKLPEKRLKQNSDVTGSRRSFFRKKEGVSSSVSKLTSKISSRNKLPQNGSSGMNIRVKSPVKERKDICRCARFKQPNQLTCFGQKCPCYRDKKACFDCLCNGCKNPRRHSDSAPPLMHMNKTKDNLCLSPDVDLSMPRLSPVPRI